MDQGTFKGLQCDFCSSHRVVKGYVCQDFVTLDGVVQSVGSWAACAECSRLIDENKFEALSVRATDSFLVKFGVADEFREQIMVFMRKLHREFSRLRVKVN